MYQVSWIMDHGSWIIRSSCHHVNFWPCHLFIFSCHIVILSSALNFLKGGGQNELYKLFTEKLQISKCLCKLLNSARILVKRGGCWTQIFDPKLSRIFWALQVYFVGLCEDGCWVGRHHFLCAQFLHPYWGRGPVIPPSLFAALAILSTFPHKDTHSLFLSKHTLCDFFSHFLTFFGNQF